jgi:hypothetical protein
MSLIDLLKKIEDYSPEEFKKSILEYVSKSRYEILFIYLYLFKLDKNSKNIITFSFKELEQKLQIPLPSDAYQQKEWWRNELSEQGEMWIMAGWKVIQIDLIEQVVVFARDEGILLKTVNKRTSWSNLKDFFSKLPEKQNQIYLTFEELGKIRGTKLPDTAFRDRTWWANTKGSQGSAWLSAEWEVENVFLQSQIAVFRRKNSNHMTNIQEYIKNMLDKPDKFNPADQKMLADWICFCPKIGWYFEAKILFEKGGLRLDAFDESKQVELNEAYQRSQRELNYIIITTNDHKTRTTEEDLHYAKN